MRAESLMLGEGRYVGEGLCRRGLMWMMSCCDGVDGGEGSERRCM